MVPLRRRFQAGRPLISDCSEACSDCGRSGRLLSGCWTSLQNQIDLFHGGYITYPAHG